MAQERELTRLEAFSDGVIAIIITIMVLELKVPEGGSWEDLQHVTPKFLAYMLSFIFVGIYWNNHHHLLRAAAKITPRIMWANMFLLFCLSIVPFTTAWVGENHNETLPAMLYGILCFVCGLAYTLLLRSIVSLDEHAVIKQSIGKDYKGIVSEVMYLLAIILSFVHPYISYGLFVAVALMWFIPEKRLSDAV